MRVVSDLGVYRRLHAVLVSPATEPSGKMGHDCIGVKVGNLNMDNPWTLLRRTPPFVLPMDADIIETFNSWRPPDADVRIRTQHLPEPFIGKRDAPILILGLNPRYTSENDAYHDGHAYFADVHRRNLMHEVMEYPFYPLDPKLEGSPTYTYWVTGYGTVPAALGRVIRACQPDGQYRVAQNILAVELGAYPSENWSPDYPFFPSLKIQ